MRPEVLERLRMTMRGEPAMKAAGTVGTLEPAPFQQKFQPVPIRSNGEFQPKKPGVPTVPTVPTQFVGGKRKTPILAEKALEPALEPSRNAPSKTLSFDPEALQREADRRSREAAEAGRTDRYCACGTLATVAVGRFKPSLGNPEGVARWLCPECFDAELPAAEREPGA